MGFIEDMLKYEWNNMTGEQRLALEEEHGITEMEGYVYHSLAIDTSLTDAFERIDSYRRYLLGLY
jgi:hypothetical protein